MTVSFDDIRGEVLPGGHLVARVPGIVIVIRRDEGTGQASSADLLALIRQAAQDSSPAPGRDLARLLTEWVVTTSSVPGFGTIAATEEGIAVFLHGDISVSELPTDNATSGNELLHLSGRTAAFTVDRLLPWPAGPLVLAAGATPDPEGGSTAIGVLGWSGLVEGLVPGEGIVLGARSTVSGKHGGGRHHSPMPPAPAPAQQPLMAAPTGPRRAGTGTNAGASGRPAGPCAPGRRPGPGATPGPTPVAPPAPVAAAAPSRRPHRLHPRPPRLRRPPHRPRPNLRRPPRPPPAGPPAASPAPPAAPPPPPPPGAAPPKLRPPRVFEQIHGSHVHEARRPPLPIAGVKQPAPGPVPLTRRRTSSSRDSAAHATTTTTPGCRSVRSAESGWTSAPAF